ncbi:thiol-disulfide isomerase/thioredoxin [Pedobacter sp. AK017]|uniref:TlpA family protein disulfide reductase n=1 Tax=Pedobacter sp. AK017 TaxID=2723073 RepID=UPI0016138123|nr:TlpA disulfide reductase family protein [Pedobacter sp. AK017]MBB5436951.1 thiol-disulfide isomerase/thioredoxin [Pedobacter sp. AK017]
MKALLISIFLFASFFCMGNQRHDKQKDKFATAQIRISYGPGVQAENWRFSYSEHQWPAMSGFIANLMTTDTKSLLILSFKNKETFLYIGLYQILKSGFVGKYGLSNYLISPGDNVHLTVTTNGLSFSGKGSEKFQAIYIVDKALDSLDQKKQEENAAVRKEKGQFYFDNLRILDQMEGLKSYRHRRDSVIRTTLKANSLKLEDRIYQLIECNFLGTEEYGKWNMYCYYMRKLIQTGKDSSLIMQKINAAYEEGGDQTFRKFGDDILALSSGYLQFKYYLALIPIVPERDGYSYIKDHFTGLLRDRLITTYLVNQKKRLKDSPILIKDALNFVTTGYCRDILNNMNNNLAPGAMAFNFSLSDSTGKVIRQQDLAGKVVLLDFYFTGCGGCKALKEQMENVVKKFENNSAIAFVSISIDKDKQEWKTGLNSHLYTHPGSIDLNTGGLGEFHPIVKHYNVVGYPTMVLIDKTGRIITGSPPRPYTPERETQLMEMLELALKQ